MRNDDTVSCRPAENSQFSDCFGGISTNCTKLIAADFGPFDGALQNAELTPQHQDFPLQRRTAPEGGEKRVSIQKISSHKGIS
jgi:hypothetical protein